MNRKSRPCPFCSKERFRRRNKQGVIKKIKVTCDSSECLIKLKERTSITLSEIFKVKAIELGYGKWAKGYKLTEEHKTNISKGLVGRKHSSETRSKLSIAKIGIKNPMWNGGTTKIWMALRNNLVYKHWRRLAITPAKFLSSAHLNQLNVEELFYFYNL